MAELDIEALKQLDKALWRLILGEDQVDAIIAALEDRQRLRAAAKNVRIEWDEGPCPQMVGLAELHQLAGGE